MKHLLLVVVSIALAVTGLVIDNQPPKPTAYDICWTAHHEISGESEKACGDALDASNQIFMCSKSGEYCWTEQI